MLFNFAPYRNGQTGKQSSRLTFFDQFRPVTIYSLTCGCSLLICGSLSDVIGSKKIFVAGCFLQCIFTIACGLSRTGGQMIAFRAISGIAASFCLPSAVSLINIMFPSGKSRNAAFATMGGAGPVCFGIGLVLGGFITGTIGWQWGFYIAAIVNFFMLLISVWQLPEAETIRTQSIWSRLINDIDWVGVFLASAGLALLSYVLGSVFPMSFILSIHANSYSQSDHWQPRENYVSCQHHTSRLVIPVVPRIRILGRPTRKA